MTGIWLHSEFVYTVFLSEQKAYIAYTYTAFLDNSISKGRRDKQRRKIEEVCLKHEQERRKREKNERNCERNKRNEKQKERDIKNEREIIKNTNKKKGERERNMTSEK